MYISQIEISKYRVFNSNIEISFSNLTVLTGKNNIGKSTVLQALDLFFSTLSWVSFESSGQSWVRSRRYKEEFDYPVQYEGKKGRKPNTKITVSCFFSNEEVQQAKADADIDIKNLQKISIVFDKKKGVPEFFSEGHDEDSSRKVCAWVHENFKFVYISSDRMMDGTRSKLLRALVYQTVMSKGQKKRLKKVAELYENIAAEFKKIGAELSKDLSDYMSDIKDVNFVLNEKFDFEEFISIKDVQMNDGVNTSISQKGDGFKSIFSLSIMHYLAQQKYGKNFIFGIEEPEAHLNSGAIYDVKRKLYELSTSFQVLYTTHSPILIERTNIGQNLIVQLSDDSKVALVRPAKSLKEIAKVLGVQPQENLLGAELVIFVEGVTESNCILHLLKYAQPSLEGALRDGRVRVQPTRGASKMPSMARAYALYSTECLALLDNDKEGNEAYENLKKDSCISHDAIFHIPLQDGFVESEFEDLFDPKLYLSAFNEVFKFDLDEEKFLSYRNRIGSSRRGKAKWSNVMRGIFAEYGIKDWALCEEKVRDTFSKAICKHISEISSPIFKRMAEYVASILDEKSSKKK